MREKIHISPKGNVSDIAHKIRVEAKDDGYTSYHAKRYAMLLKLLSNYITDSKIKLLDIGRSELTTLMANAFDIKVDSVGFMKDEKTETGFNYQFNLNDAQYKANWRQDMPQYDIIVMAEVIEHLYTSPSLVLSFIKTLLSPDGILIIQTPNAVVLHKRILLLLGYNPYMLIREDVTHPGHFREYTIKELKRYIEQNGLRIEKVFFGNYFDYRYRKIGKRQSLKPKRVFGLLNLVYNMVPRKLKPGITIVSRLPG